MFRFPYIQKDYRNIMKESQEIRAKVRVFWEGGLKTRGVIRGFEVETDKPKSSFGTNTAPAPMEVFISAIGSCLLSTFVWAVLKSRITIQDCIVDVKAFTDSTDKIEKITKAKITLTVWAEEKYNANLEKCFDISIKTCTLTGAVSFPIENIFQFKEDS